MTNAWDSSTEAVLGGLAKPLTPFSPEKAAKSQRLGADIGVPPPIIDLDPEGWQKRIADQRNAEAIKSTPELQGYIAKDPLNAKVSRDDMPALAKVADRAAAVLPVVNDLPAPGVPPVPLLARPDVNKDDVEEEITGFSASRLGKAFVEGFYPSYEFDANPLPDVTDMQVVHPTPSQETREGLTELGFFGPGPWQQINEAFWGRALDMTDLFLRLGGGGIHLTAELAKEAAETLNIVAGAQVMDPVSFSRAIGGVVESEMTRQGAELGAPHSKVREATRFVIDKIKSDIGKNRAVEPGSPPPKPLAPIEIDALVRQALLNALFDSVEETQTKGRSPSSIHDFSVEAVKDALVLVPVDSVGRVYAEKGVTPKAGDGVLGFEPSIAEQIDRAKMTGGDVKIPLAGYLAHGDKALHESLQGDLKVGTGPSVNEAAALVKETKDLTALREEKAAKLIEAEPAAQVSYSPAVKIEDKIYTGGSHVDAIDRAAKQLGVSEDDIIAKYGRDDAFNNLDGFVSSDGTFLTRAEAYKAVEAEPAKLVEPTPAQLEPATPVEPFIGDMVPSLGEPSIPISEVTEADFTSRFSLVKPKGEPDSYAIMRDNKQVGSFRASLDPADPTTVRVIGVDVTNAIDRPGVGDQRKLLRELQRDFPTATHVQGPRLGGSRMGTSARIKIPKPEELVRKALHIEPLFQDAAAAGMTEREFKLYSNNLRDYQRLVAEKKRATAERAARKEFKVLSETERKKAGEDFDNSKVIVTEELMRSSGVKFDDAVVDKATIPRGLTASEAKGGVRPDDIAGSLGYSTGAELLRDLEGLHQDRAGLSPKEYRDSVLGRRVKENVPEMPDFTDEAFSEPLSRVLFDDLRVMQRQTEGAEGMPPLALDELKSRASREFAQIPVREASDLKEWERLVRENGRKAELALLSGDIPKAFKFKNQQLLAHLMAREAIRFSREFALPLGQALRAEAREARRAATEGRAAVEDALLPPEPEAPKLARPAWTSPTVLLKRYNKAKPPENIAQDFIDQIQGILTQHGVPIKRDGGELGAALQGKDLRDFVAEKNRQGANIQVADFVYDSRGAKKLEDMTVDNHRELFRSIRSLDHAGREEMSAMKGAEKLRLEELEQQIVDNINSLPMTYKPELGRAGQAVKHLRYQGDALLVRPEQMLQDLDLRDPLGPLTQSVNKLLQDGKHWENDLHKWATDEFRKFPEIERAEELVADVPFRDSFTSTDGIEPGRPYPMKRIDAIMTAVQMGNESSAEMTVITLLGGEVRGKTRFEQGPESAIRFVRDWLEKTLTPKDWEFVEAVWSLYDKIKPLEDLVYERTSGVAPRTLAPTPWNGHSGGYFPIIHDPIGGSIAAKRGNSPFDSHFRPTATSTKHAKERTGVFMPVRIIDAFDTVPGDVRARLHAVAMKEAIDNAHKILSRPKIIEAMNKHYGPEYTKALSYWLQEIANHWNQDDAMLAGWAALMRGARKNLIISTLALNANVILSPNIGPFLKQVFTSPADLRGKFNNPEWTKFILENSGEMRHRMENIDRDMRTVFADAMGTRSKYSQFRSTASRWGMYLAVKMDTKLAMLEWDKEYTRAMETGTTTFYRGEPRSFTHEQAVDAAEQLVRLYFGSHSTLDLPGIMRMSETAKTFGTMFYGFQNVMYGRTRDVIQLSRSGAKRMKEGDMKGARADFSQALAESWMFIGLTAAFGYLYAPSSIDELIKKGKYGEAAGHLLAGQLMSIVPGLRDVGSALLEGYPTKASPLTEAVVQAWKAGKDILYKDQGEPSTIKDIATAAGLIFGVPGARQFGRSAQYIWNATHGHDSDRYFTDWVRGLLYGKAKK